MAPRSSRSCTRTAAARNRRRSSVLSAIFLRSFSHRSRLAIHGVGPLCVNPSAEFAESAQPVGLSPRSRRPLRFMLFRRRRGQRSPQAVITDKARSGLSSGGKKGKPASQRIFLISAESQSRLPWQVSWLVSGSLTCLRFAFPGCAPSGTDETGCPHIQWRDRAGISPAFPVSPSREPKASKILSRRARGVNEARRSGSVLNPAPARLLRGG
jgi:hypothetical protein